MTDNDDNDNDDDDDDEDDLKPLNTSKGALNTNPPFFWDTLYISIKNNFFKPQRAGQVDENPRGFFYF